MLHALQHIKISSRFPNPAIRDTMMGSLHLQGGWSFSELSRAFGCDYKTVQRHLGPFEAKNRIAVELHDFENFSEKVNQFNAVSGLPTIETTINTSE
jgi:hypothetical protein